MSLTLTMTCTERHEEVRQIAYTHGGVERCVGRFDRVRLQSGERELRLEGLSEADSAPFVPGSRHQVTFTEVES